VKTLPRDFIHDTYYLDLREKLISDLIGVVTANHVIQILPIFGTFLDGIFRDENGKTRIPVCYNIETEIAVGKFTNNKDVLPKNIEINIDVFTIYNRYKVVEIEENKKLFIYYTGRVEEAIESFRRAEAKKETENY
jgi:hypothetical protein